MRLKELVHEKKYLTRIYLWVTFLIIAAILTLSTVILVKVENSVLSKEYQSNQLVLSQMKFNINFMDETIRNICLSTYYRSDVQNLMNKNGAPTYDDMNTINQLHTTIVQSNPYVLSIYVYNNRNKLTYSTFNSFIYDDAGLNQLIKTFDTIPVLRPIVRRTMTYHVRDLVEYRNVVTYFMYEMTDANRNMNGAVIINIKLDWLVDNIRTIDAADRNSRNQVFILDDAGEFFDTGSAQANENQQFRSALKDAYRSHGDLDSARDADSFKAAIGGKDYLVTYIRMKETNWSILIAQPNDTLIAYINSLKTSIFLITGIILVLILVAAYSISRGLYKPVEKLIRQVRTNGQEELPDASITDEFAYLNEAYENSRDLLKRYSLEKTDNIMSIKLYFLRKLLIHSLSIPDEEFERNRGDYGVNLEAGGSFCVISVKPDTEAMRNGLGSQTREAMMSALSNDISAALSNRFRNEAVEMEGDEIAFIVSAGGSGTELPAEVAALLRDADRAFKASCHASFSAAVSDPVADVKELTKAYTQAADTLKYRFITGPDSVILSDVLRNVRSSRQFDYSYKYEKQLVEDLRGYDMEKVATSLSRIIEEVRGLDFNDIMFSLTHLVSLVRNVVCELNSCRREPVNINALLSGLDIAQCETIDRFRERLMEVLQFVVSRHTDEHQPDNRDSRLADAIRAMIDAGYGDCNLNVSDLATRSGISAPKISRAFKEHAGMSIPEYINEVRMRKAVEWIENSKLPISEVMRKVGIENESYFYRIFKARFGTTPREHAMSRLFKPS